LNDLEAQQRPGAVQWNHIDRARKSLFEQAPDRQCALEELLAAHLIIEEHGNVYVAEVMRLALSLRPKEIDGDQAFFVGEHISNLGANRLSVHDDHSLYPSPLSQSAPAHHDYTIALLLRQSLHCILRRRMDSPHFEVRR